MKKNVKQSTGKGKKPNQGNKGTQGKASVPGRGNRRAIPSQIAVTVKRGLDAFHPTHIPLPHSVAPYHVVRQHTRYTSSSKAFMLGPTHQNGAVGGTRRDWTNQIGWSATSDADQVNSSLVPMTVFTPSSFSEAGTELTPAAFSVRVRCLDPLLSASGVTYIGRYRACLGNPSTSDARTFSSLFDASLSYIPYLAVTNSHLATHAKQINALPASMTDLGDFSPQTPSSTTYWAQNNGPEFAGFCPIFIWNKSGAQLEIEIAVEWRVRVDPYNPLAASGKQHAPTSPGVWHAIMNSASSAGHGVEDVVAAGAGMAAASFGGFEGIMGALGGFASGALPTLEALAPLLLL